MLDGERMEIEKNSMVRGFGEWQVKWNAQRRPYFKKVTFEQGCSHTGIWETLGSLELL